MPIYTKLEEIYQLDPEKYWFLYNFKEFYSILQTMPENKDEQGPEISKLAKIASEFTQLTHSTFEEWFNNIVETKRLDPNQVKNWFKDLFKTKHIKLDIVYNAQTKIYNLDPSGENELVQKIKDNYAQFVKTEENHTTNAVTPYYLSLGTWFLKDLYNYLTKQTRTSQSKNVTVQMNQQQTAHNY